MGAYRGTVLLGRQAAALVAARGHDDHDDTWAHGQQDKPMVRHQPLIIMVSANVRDEHAPCLASSVHHCC